MEIRYWLKEADGIVIECEEENINPYTLVSVTPLVMEGKKSSSGGQRTMTLQEAFKIPKRQVIKGQKLIDYLKTRIGKKEFD